jgi:tRNA(Ile)-lysidine synthase TilS/MesJ
MWADRDETDNYEQSYDREMARQQVLPLVEKEKEKIVDAMIN